MGPAALFFRELRARLKLRPAHDRAGMGALDIEEGLVGDRHVDEPVEKGHRLVLRPELRIEELGPDRVRRPGSEEDFAYLT